MYYMYKNNEYFSVSKLEFVENNPGPTYTAELILSTHPNEKQYIGYKQYANSSWLNGKKLTEEKVNQLKAQLL